MQYMCMFPTKYDWLRRLWVWLEETEQKVNFQETTFIFKFIS